MINENPIEFLAGLLFEVEDFSNEKFSEELDKYLDNSIVIGKDDGASIGTILSNRKRNKDFADLQFIKTDLSKENVLKFLSKIKISESDDPVEHANALSGLINPARDPEILEHALRKGFDSGTISSNHKDILEIAVEQTQGVNKGDKLVYKSSNVQSLKRIMADFEMVVLILKSGKSFGYEGREGVREANIFKNIVETGKLPDEYQVRDSDDPNFALVRFDNKDFMIQKSEDGLDRISAARFYLHKFHGREINPRSYVMINPVTFDLSNEDDKPSSFGIMNILGCCWSKETSAKVAPENHGGNKR